MSSERWSENELYGLGPDEYDFQEFKGTAWLAVDHDIIPDFLTSLSKQLSAFANGAGGRVFIGLDDNGTIDGGAPIDLKKGGTRSWLEDVTPGLVDPPLATFNVHEVGPESPESPILEGHAVYVIEIPGSALAPHQAVDHRYYLRIAGKSRPMGHLHVQDVLRRTSQPQVQMGRVAPYGPEERITTDPRGPTVHVCFRAFIENTGRTLATHVGAEIELPRPLVNQDVRQRTLAGSDVSLTQRPGTVNFFRYHPNPVFPSQDLFFMQFWSVLHRGNLDAVRTGQARIAWRIYADDAPVRQGHRALSDYAVVRDAVSWLDSALDK